MQTIRHAVTWGLGWLLVLSACTNKKSPPPAAAPKPALRALGQSLTPADNLSDETIGRAVRRRLDLEGAAETSGVIVQVDEGVVTLRGTALTQAAIWKSVAAAASVTGVKQVVNQIILPGRMR